MVDTGESARSIQPCDGATGQRDEHRRHSAVLVEEQRRSRCCGRGVRQSRCRAVDAELDQGTSRSVELGYVVALGDARRLGACTPGELEGYVAGK